ncbi:hypothetical protein PQR66_03310 [Paraburkholderia agricolaris]|uniref:Ribbon-helix-helix protein, copG family n=1 Tax=Paraburkholderia agricolaris TaxID=2152888 RepID=A0ABW8ZGY6_9BURK
MFKKAKTAEDHRKDAEKAAARADAAKKKLATLQAELASVEAQQTALRESIEGEKRARAEIRQGVKATVDTVPMPVRLEVSQVKLLKVLAALEGTTASAIIRDCIKEHLTMKAATNPTFANAALMVQDR